MDVLIVGAGIGGLSAGISLKRAGHQVRVVEAARELKPVGAGLLLQPNAMSALAELGLDNTVEEAGRRISRGQLVTQGGQTIQDMDLLFGGRRRAAVGIHRSVLQTVLLDALGEGRVALGHPVLQVDEDGVVFEGGGREKADVVVAADGLHSVLAETLGAPEPRYAGYTCWRGVTPEGINRAGSPKLSERFDAMREVWGKGRRFGIVPIDGERLYWFATLNTPQGESDARDSIIAKLEGVFGSFPEVVRELIRLTPRDKILRHDIVDRPPRQSWGRGRLTLLGDAAHPMTPNLGQGACQAIVDAVALGNYLNGVRMDDVQSQLRAYEQERIPKTTKIAQASWRMGQMGQLENGLLRWLRDRAIQLTPASVGERQILALTG